MTELRPFASPRSAAGIPRVGGFTLRRSTTKTCLQTRRLGPERPTPGFTRGSSGPRLCEVPRIRLPRTPVNRANRAREKGRIRCEWPDLPDSAHVLRLLALPTLGRLVTNRLAFLQAPVPLSLYGRVVHEDVFAAFVGADEAVALLLVKVLHGSPGHAFSPFPETSTTKSGPTVPPPSTPVDPRSDMVA